MLGQLIGTLCLVGFWFAVISMMLLLGGCDALVADNPACIYDCASSSAYTGGMR